MRICVVFNPVARGNKARHFARWLDGVAAECTLKPTTGPNDARQLAAEAVRLLRQRGFDAVRLADGYPEWRDAGLPL